MSALDAILRTMELAEVAWGWGSIKETLQDLAGQGGWRGLPRGRDLGAEL